MSVNLKEMSIEIYTKFKGQALTDPEAKQTAVEAPRPGGHGGHSGM